MKTLKLAGVFLVLVGVAATAILLAPVAEGQAVVVSRPDRDQVDREVEILGGRRGEIGVSVRDVDADDVTREKLPTQAGVVVTEVRSESPAARAGLSAGDVVVAFDDEPVRSARQFARLVRETPPRRTVKGALLRDGKRIEFQVTLDTGSDLDVWSGDRVLERLRDLRLSFPRVEFPEVDVQVHVQSGRLGVGVQALTPQLADYFGVQDGVLVASVASDSPAEKAGLRAGDVITAVNDRRISDAGDLRGRLSRLESGEEFSVTIVRDKKTMTLKARLERRSDRDAPRRRGPRTPV